MDTQHIQSFLCLARTLNFTSAAAELKIAVSTLSRQMSVLESELNVQLFLRDTRNVTLTKSGVYFQQEFTTLYQNMQLAILNTQRIYQGFSGSLSCGVLEEITLHGTIQDRLYDFGQQHKNHTIELRRGSFQQLTDQLMDGSLDCIITFFFSIENQIDFQYKIIEDITDGVLVSSKSPLAKEKYFSAERFKNQNLIIASAEKEGSITNSAIEYCKSIGFYPRLTLVPDIDTASLMTEAGLGFSFNYANGVSTHGPGLKFIPLPVSLGPAHHIVLAWNTHTINPVTQQFIREFFQD